MDKLRLKKLEAKISTTQQKVLTYLETF